MPLLATIQTRLDAPPDRVWETVLQTRAFQYVTQGWMAFTFQEPLPPRWIEGDRLTARMWLFHVLPAPWRHTMILHRIDHDRRELSTEEGGGLLRVWNHRIRVEARPDGGSLYTDAITIDAGLLTRPVWLFAQVFFRHRQRRLRRLLAES